MARTLVAPQILPVPNCQKQTIQSYRTTPTLVAPSALPQPSVGVWPTQPAIQPNAAVWPNQPAPQQVQGFGAPQPAPQADAWADLKAPQEWSSALPTPAPSLRPKRKGRGVLAWTLFVFAGGLFAGPLLADYADQAVEAGAAWLASLAPSLPSFVRPYLPRTVEASPSVPTPQHPRGAASLETAQAPVAPVAPAEPTAQPERKPELVAQPAPMPMPVAVKRSTKNAKPHAMRGSRRKLAATVPVDEPPTPMASRPAEPKHGTDVDPFEDGAGSSAATR